MNHKQNEIWPKESPENETEEMKAKNALWYYFFDNFKLMLLDEHITEIAKQVETYKSMLKTDKV